LVTISGANFAGATAVRFGTQSATSFEVDSPSTITAKTPEESPGTVDATVTNAGGTSATGAADRFTFVKPGLAPAIKKLAPRKGSAAGGTKVAIAGAYFEGVTAVKFGAANASYEVPSTTSIVAVAPPGTPGSVPVTVVTPNGENVAGVKALFTYGPPTVTGISPNTGSKAGGTPATVSGNGFAVGAGATVFTFGKGIATSVDCTTSSMCTMLAPAAAKAGAVNVRAKVNGKTSKKNPPADQFTYE
jgi:IPT/TIG domain